MPLANTGPADYAIVSSNPPRWHQMAAITDKLKWEYAQQHGYHFFADESEIFGPAGSRTPMPGAVVPILGFIKLDLLLHFLPQYKAVVWMDSDLLITNRERKLEGFLAKCPDKDVILGYDNNGLHSTVIFARNTPTARDYLHAANTMGRTFYLGDPWHEMTALRHFWLDPNYHDRIGFLSAKELCPIYKPEYVQFGLPLNVGAEFGWEPGDWTLHLSALHDGRRLRLAEHFADPAHHRLTPPEGP